MYCKYVSKGQMDLRPESDSQEGVEMAVEGHSLAQSRRMKGVKGREAVFPGRQ